MKIFRLFSKVLSMFCEIMLLLVNNEKVLIFEVKNGN